tara:strand:- start:249 stop:1064 length:816 start_codon:yes stop_codon:yes gene_type:complete
MSNEQTYDSMPQEDYEYSIASQLSYDYFDNNNDAEKIQTSLDTYLEGYTFDPDYSNNNASTIIRPDGTAILAYRGTRPTNFDDLNTDASILAGQHRTDIPHPRFIEAMHHYNLVKEKYNNLDITGHSLGGTLADYVGRMNDEKAVVFNPGESPFSLSVIPKSDTSKTTIYRTNTFDIVSFSNSMYPHAQSIRVVPQTDSQSDWFGSHNLTNFLPSIDMLPLSNEPDIIIPSRIPVETQKQEYKQDERFITNLCLEQPELYICKKRPKLKMP